MREKPWRARDPDGAQFLTGDPVRNAALVLGLKDGRPPIPMLLVSRHIRRLVREFGCVRLAVPDERRWVTHVERGQAARRPYEELITVE